MGEMGRAPVTLAVAAPVAPDASVAVTVHVRLLPLL